LSDIHGNLEALRAVLHDCAGRIDAVLCLGDTVGYGADPLACVELVAEQAQATVAGNHEYAVAGRLGMAWFNRYARVAAEWTQQRLDEDHARLTCPTRRVGLPGDRRGRLRGVRLLRDPLVLRGP
jgi:predicted phosphodiesterase